MSRLEEIRQRVAAATPGPWRWVHDSGSTMLWTSEPVGGPGHILTPHVCESCDKHGLPCLGPTVPDAAFIAAARDDVPFLLALVAAYRAALEIIEAAE